MKSFSVQEKLQILNDFLHEAESCCSDHCRMSDSDFNNWHERLVTFIRNCLPNPQMKISSMKSWGRIWGDIDLEFYSNLPFIRDSISYLQAWRSELLLYHDDQSQIEGKQVNPSNSCFLVHGHNEDIRRQINEFLHDSEDIEVDPIVLHKKANSGRTIIEKFEQHANVDFAICIWSADDFGGATGKDPQPRARQNVVLETGFFWGKLGRDRVIVVHEAGVEIPSDFQGMLYIPFTGNWKDELRKEIKTIYQKCGEKKEE